MKLLFVLQESGKAPGGVVTVVRELCRGWRKSDEITILVNRCHPATEAQLLGRSAGGQRLLKRLPFLSPSDHPPRTLRSRILLRPVRWLWMVVLLIYLTYWLRQQQIEGVISHNGGWPGGELNRLAIVAAWLVRIRHRILVIHNLPWQPPNWLQRIYRAYGQMFSILATKVVTVSRFCRDSLQEKAGFKNVVVIYNGISINKKLPERSPKEYQELPWPKKYPTIGFVGEMHPRKGVHILVDALAQVKMPCELVLIGEGDSSYVEQLMQTAGRVRHPVHFLGFRSDMERLYSSMDIVVMPSVRYESFGMVILEAMRAGKPVVCSDFSGMKEIVADGETGTVVPTGHVEMLAMAIERLLRDTSLRCCMGAAGRRRLAKKFSSCNMVRNYDCLFR